MQEWEELLRETTSALGRFEATRLEQLVLQAESLALHQQMRGEILKPQELILLKDTLFALMENTKRSIHLMRHLSVEKDETWVL